MRFDRNLWVLFISLLLWGLGSGLYLYTWPVYVAELGGGPRELGLLQTLAFGVAALSYLPGGYLTDRFDRKAILLAGWATAMPAPLLYALAANWLDLIPGVVVYNLSMFSNAALRAYVTDLVRPERLGSAFVLIDIAWPAGLIVSPVLGGFWAQQGGMRGVLFASFIFYLASTVVLILLEAQKPVSALRLGPEAVPVTNPRFIGVMLLGIGIYFTQFLAIPFFTPYLVDVGKMDLGRIGILSSLVSFGSLVLGPALGGYSDKVGKEAALGVCLGLCALSFGLTLAGNSFWVFALAMFLRGATIVSWSLFSAAAILELPVSARGRGFGIIGLSASLAQAVAPCVAGLMYERDPHLPFSVSALCLVVIAAVTVLYGRRQGELSGES